MVDFVDSWFSNSFICLNEIYLFCFFFFFKQKTAYEIYQCDWSSDVCSSDLSVGDVVYWPASPVLLQLQRWMRPIVFEVSRSLNEIGRASCRERV